jgi:rhodanese-related sulfurtransferase
MKLSYSILLYLCIPFYLFGAEYPDISVKELQSAIKQGNVAVIDVNGARSFSNGHIPTAIDFSTDGKKLASYPAKRQKHTCRFILWRAWLQGL